VATADLARHLPGASRRPSAFRHSRTDALLVAASAGHGLLLLIWPSILVVAVGLWWTANTSAHNFLHLPFFRSRRLNRVYSLYLSLLLGLPLTVWRERHLAHHADRPVRLRLDVWFVAESATAGILWASLLLLSPHFVLTTYLPGWLIGLAICQVHGYYEHERGATSHYGRLYNVLFFNDGYHVEHHGSPGTHWSRLRRGRSSSSPPSRWPPVLRWLEVAGLDGLERLVMRSGWLQRYVVRVHERAFRRLLQHLPPVASVTIVGGGLFPRSAVVASRIWPEAAVTIVDGHSRHLDMARQWVSDRTTFRREWFDPDRAEPVDLLIAPLAYVGDRHRLYASRAAPVVIVHDWIWAARGDSVVVSWLLLKRLNAVRNPRSQHS
jgi:hypothetical protein